MHRKSRIENGELRNGGSLSQSPILNSAFFIVIFLGGLALYTSTLNGDVQPADSGELQIAAITLGIPHPPGYPLHTMLGWLFAQVPIGSPFGRVSFLSVVASSLTLVLVSATVWQLGLKQDKADKRAGEDKDVSSKSSRSTASPLSYASRLLATLASVLALATSTTFWAQATTTNIRSLTAFFTALMLFATARAWVTRKPSTLILFALAFGFGVGHHVSLIFIGLVLGVFVLLCVLKPLPTGERVGEGASNLPKRWLALSALVLLAAQLVWLYLPLRDAAGARFAPGNLTTLDGLFFHIFARGFAGDMLAFAAPEFLFDRLALLPTLLEFQFSTPLLALMGLAAIVLVARARTRALGLAWLLAFALHLFITITYRAPQTVEYAIPCWVIACTTLGAGLMSMTRRWSILWQAQAQDRLDDGRRWEVSRLLSIVLCLVALFFAVRDGTQRLPSYVALAHDPTVRDRAQSVLRYAQSDGVILSQWHQATPMWALQDIEGLQRGVRVEYVYPRGAQSYADSFALRATEVVSNQLTYATSLYERELRAHGLRTFPLSNTPAWRVAPQFHFPTRAYPSTRFDDRIVVVGPLGLNDVSIETGQSLHVDLWWYRVGGREAGDSITIRILRPDGRLAANADVRLDDDEQSSIYYFKRVALGIPLDLPPGQYALQVGAYRVTDGAIAQFTNEGGDTFKAVTTITVEATTHAPITQHPFESATGTAEPQLIGADYDTGIADRLRVWTHWRLGTAAREVALVGADNQPLAAPKQLAAVASHAPARYLSLPFDIAPTQDVRIGFSGLRLPASVDGERYVPFGDQMALVASSSRRTDTTLKADLTWLAARPIVDDYVISVRIEGDGFYHTHDSVPALGAVPTLKWIRGSRVLDRHPFELGDYRHALRGTVVVYDSVSQLPLPPLDERYENGVTISINP